MSDDSISIAKICMYAQSKAGMSAVVSDRVTQSRIDWLASEGYIELRERTVDLPAVNMPDSCKQVAMFDTWSPRTVTIRTYHLLRWPPT